MRRFKLSQTRRFRTSHPQAAFWTNQVRKIVPDTQPASSARPTPSLVERSSTEKPCGTRQRRFGDAASATGQAILINNVAFTVVGVVPSEFFGVDPASAPHVYLPMRASLLFDPGGGRAYLDPNYYWVEMMGRLRPGVDRARAQAALAGPFGQWVATTATTDLERANTRYGGLRTKFRRLCMCRTRRSRLRSWDE